VTGLHVGLMVHFVRFNGDVRAAIVTHDRSDETDGLVNLDVELDGNNDNNLGSDSMTQVRDENFVQGVSYDAGGSEGTWHFIPA
jgi:hypothetical protein